MKIAIVAHSVFPISQPYHGGLEKFIHTLACELSERGIQVDLYCNSRSSDGPYNKIPFTDFEYKWDNNFDSLNKDYKSLIEELKLCTDYDLIHNNSLNNDMLSLSEGATPLLTTIHVPPIEGFDQAIYNNFVNKNNYLSIVSNSCLKSWTALKECKVIHNAIHTNSWASNLSNDREGAIWFGRICPEKGVERSIQAAIKAGLFIKIAGSINDNEYFNYLSRKYKGKFEHIGLCSHSELNNLIASSKVFIKAPIWEEPFGLVYLESLACGTPVATYNSNIANELLNNKVACISNTNIRSLSKSVLEAVETINPEDCIKYVKQNFDISYMVEQYLDYYKEIIKCTR